MGCFQKTLTQDVGVPARCRARITGETSERVGITQRRPQDAGLVRCETLSKGGDGTPGPSVHSRGCTCSQSGALDSLHKTWLGEIQLPVGSTWAEGAAEGG